MSTFEVLDAFSLFRRQLAQLRACEMKSMDLGPQQMMILYRLSLSEATMGELAEYTVSDKASISRTVALLAKSGWVKRSDREGDRRIIVIELTATGRKKASKAIELRNLIGQMVNETLSASERKTLVLLLGKAAQGLLERRKENTEI